MNLETYLQLDLGPRSEAAANLFSRLEHEATTDIALTPVFGPDGRPPYLTEGMWNWYANQVRPARTGALKEVMDEFQKKRMRGGSPGTLFEYERDRIILETLDKIHSEHEIFRQRKDAGSTYAQLKEKTTEY